MDRRNHLEGIESLRAYAALIVIAFHTVWLAGFDPTGVLAAIKWHGGRGVPLFFAVSAFSLAYGYGGRLASAPQIRSFYVRRFFRIAPLYYLACIVQVLANLNFSWLATHPLDVFLASTFLFNLSPPHVEGIALASWSIGVEMLFYLAFPLILAGCKTLREALIMAVCSIMLAMLLVIFTGTVDNYVQHSLLFNLPYFAAGLVAVELHRLRPWSTWRCVSVAAGSAALLIWLASPLGSWIAQPLGNGAYQSLWALPIGALCLGMASGTPRLLSNPLSRWFGKVSFGLYLAHPHVISALKQVGIFQQLMGWTAVPNLQFLMAFVTITLVTAGVAALLFEVVERPGQNLGRRFTA